MEKKIKNSRILMVSTRYSNFKISNFSNGVICHTEFSEGNNWPKKLLGKSHECICLKSGNTVLWISNIVSYTKSKHHSNVLKMKFQKLEL